MKSISSYGFFLILSILPLAVTDTYILHLFIMAAIWSIYSSAFNLILSAGQLSLGQAAFFGIGAYTSSLMVMRLGVPFVPAILAAGLFTCIIGFLVGRITLKMRGAHFVLVTFAFAEITRLVATNWVTLTEGPMALRNIPRPSVRIPGILDIQFLSYRSVCYLVLFVAFLTGYVSYRLLCSRYGRAFAALRGSEDLAESVGISHLKFVTSAVVVSTFFTGIAGSLYAHYVTLISPEIFSFGNMITLLIMVIGGGSYTVAGPVAGAIVFTLLPELLRVVANYRMLIFGAFLTLIVIFMSEGIVPQCRALFRQVLRYCGYMDIAK